MIVKLDKSAQAVIEEIINKNGKAIVSVRKGAIVIVEQKEKVVYRTDQSRD